MPKKLNPSVSKSLKTKADDVNRALGFWFSDVQYCDAYAQDLVDLALSYAFLSNSEKEEKLLKLKELKALGFTPKINLILCFCVIHGISDRTVNAWLKEGGSRYQEKFAEAKKKADWVLKNRLDADYANGEMRKEDHVYRSWLQFREKTDLPKEDTRDIGLTAENLVHLANILQK